MIDTANEMSQCNFKDFLEKCRFLPIFVHFWAVNVKGRFSNLEYRWFSKCVGSLVAKSWKNLTSGKYALKPTQKKLQFPIFELGPHFRAPGPQNLDFYDFGLFLLILALPPWKWAEIVKNRDFEALELENEALTGKSASLLFLGGFLSVFPNT